jgi:ketosteroid isomerase-like protein
MMQSSINSDCGQTKEQAIEAVRQGLGDFERYVNSLDMDQLMELYFDDVKYMQHGVDTIEGKDRLKDQFIRIFERSSNIALSIQEIDSCGDMAYAHVLTTVTLKSVDGQDPQKVILRVLEIWRRHPDNSWKLTRVSVNNPSGT